MGTHLAARAGDTDAMVKLAAEHLMVGSAIAAVEICARRNYR